MSSNDVEERPTRAITIWILGQNYTQICQQVLQREKNFLNNFTPGRFLHKEGLFFETLNVLFIFLS